MLFAREVTESSPGRFESGVDIRNSLVLVLSFGSRGKKDIFRASKLSRLKVSRTTRFTLKLKGASSNFRLEAPFFRAAVPTSAPDVPPEEKKEKDGRRRGNEKRKQNYGGVGR